MTTGLDAGQPTTAVPTKRRPGRPPTLNREAALAAARQVVAARGFDRTRYADVAAQAGIPVTTLQHAFGSLQAMLLESIQRSTAGEMSQLLDRPADPTMSAWERLSEFIRSAVGSAEEHGSWLVWLELWRVAARDPEVAAQAGIVYEQWWAHIEELIVLGADRGEFSGPLVANAREAAIATTGVIDGVAVGHILRADGPDHSAACRICLASVAAMLGHTA